MATLSGSGLDELFKMGYALNEDVEGIRLSLQSIDKSLMVLSGRATREELGESE